MATKTILILGGGIGGIVTARELRKHLGNQHRIILLDKNSYHSFSPSFIWVMIGWRKPEAIEKPLSSLERYGIEFQQAEVQIIDPERSQVITDHSTIEYDYLVLALGADLTTEIVPGLDTIAHTFYTREGAIKLNKAISTFSQGNIAIVISSLPYKFPPAPYEAAFLLESYFSKRGANCPKIKIFHPESEPLNFAGYIGSQSIQNLLIQRGIELHTAHKVTSVDQTENQIVFRNSEKYKFDLLIVIPAHRPPNVVSTSNLANEQGWISVNEKILRTRYQNVYAIGDVAEIISQGSNKLPKSGVFAHNQAEIVAFNIAQEIHNTKLQKEFSGAGFYFIETGNGRAGYIHGNFLTKSNNELSYNEPNVTYHWGKVLIEKYWLWRWF